MATPLPRSLRGSSLQFALVLAGLILTGCHVPETVTVPPLQTWFAPEYDPLGTYRILVRCEGPLPPELEEISADFGLDLVQRLQAGGRFEIVGVSSCKSYGCPVCQQLNALVFPQGPTPLDPRPADAVLHVTVTEFHAYRPMRMGIDVRLIRIADSMPLVTIKGLWEAPNDLDIDPGPLMKNHGRTLRQVASDDTELSTLTVSSPRFFARHVSASVAEFLQGDVSTRPIVIESDSSVPRASDL